MSSSRRLRSQSHNGAGNDGVIAALTDEQVLQLLGSPVVNATIQSLVDESMRKHTEETDRLITDLKEKVKILEAEVEKFGVVSDSLETSNKYNWDLTDKRLMALETTAGPKLPDGLTGDGEHEETHGQQKGVRDSERRQTIAVQARRDHTKVNSGTPTEAYHHHKAQSVIDGDTSDFKRHAKNLSTGHLALYYEDNRVVLWMPLVGVDNLRKRFFLRVERQDDTAKSDCKYRQLGPVPAPPFNGTTPTEHDILLPRTPGNFKLLLKLRSQLRTRKAALILKWQIENPDIDAVKKIAPPLPYEVEPKKSRRFHSLMMSNVRNKLAVDVLTPAKPRHVRTTVQKRLLIERISGIPASSTRDYRPSDPAIYFDVATEDQVLREEEDVTVSECEDLYESLCWMYQELVEKDLLDDKNVDVEMDFGVEVEVLHVEERMGENDIAEEESLEEGELPGE